MENNVPNALPTPVPHLESPLLVQACKEIGELKGRVEQLEDDAKELRKEIAEIRNKQRFAL